MRKLGATVILLITLSTHNVIDAGVARRQYCEDSFREVVLAARQAARPSAPRGWPIDVSWADLMEHLVRPREG